MSTVNLTIAQINSHVGNLSENVNKILISARRSYQQGSNIIVTPELSLVGYPLQGLLFRSDFIEYQQNQLNLIKKSLASFKGLHTLIGHIHRENNSLYNAISILYEGNIIGLYRKQILINSKRFNEKNCFSTGKQPLVFTIKNICFGIMISEDIYSDSVVKTTIEAGAKILIVVNASPFSINKQQERNSLIQKYANNFNCLIVYVNLIGGQDELVFDGSSFIRSPSNKCKICLPKFTEALTTVSIKSIDDVNVISGELAQLTFLPEKQVWSALVLSIHDYIYKNNLPGVIIGLSGGIDSAITLVAAVDAIGSDKVHAIMMPSRHTSDVSMKDAEEIAHRLKVQFDSISIESMIPLFEEILLEKFKEPFSSNTRGNIQSRIRGIILMGFSNQTGKIVLNTSNKSEISVGYSTLYGDTIGGFAILKDIYKTFLYRLAKWRNFQTNIIPERIISRKPSAELYKNQIDQDDLPQYKILDDIIYRYIENNESINEIISSGYDVSTVQKIVHLIHVSEHKRRQSPIGLCLTDNISNLHKYPITNGFSNNV